MDKFKKSQILKLFVIVILLSITPLLSTSLRPPYLYFVFNLLIIALGAEAGLLSYIFKAAPQNMLPSEDSANPTTTTNKAKIVEPEPTTKKKPKLVEKSSSEKIVAAVKVHKTVKKSPSTPSLFFLGAGETEVEEFIHEALDDDDQEEAAGDELFHKAETFIGNFYKQLRMQREESWKKIHGLYQKAF